MDDTNKNAVYVVRLSASSIQYLSRYYPYIPSVKELNQLPILLARYGQEFAFTLVFDPAFIDTITYCGCFPMAIPAFSEYVMAIKLHHNRCILDLKNLHIGKTVKRRCKKFELSVDKAFDQVTKMINDQHGENWLCAPLRAAFKEIFLNPDKYRMHLHSVEVWSEGKLVAGELGYVVGSIYTSLTGAYTLEGAGGVQLVALGKLLEKLGFSIWDFGMEMNYKIELGASSVPREKWIELCMTHRDKRTELKCEKTNCFDLVSGSDAKS